MATTVSPKDLKTNIKIVYDRPSLSSSVLSIEGESGIGKTEIAMQSCGEMEHFSECRVINVAHLNTEDLGIPNINGEYVTFKFTETLFRPAKGRVLVILDELNRPPNDNVLNTLMGILNERRVMGTKIPDFISFISTLNPTNKDYPQTQDIFRDLAMRRRLQSMTLRFDIDQTLAYFRPFMDETLFRFLQANPDQILLPGKINCPRNWVKFNNDVLSHHKWTKAEIKQLVQLAASFMDDSTLPFFKSFWSGTLEKPLTAKEILSNLPKHRSKLETQIAENKMDLLSASATDIRATLLSMDSIDVNQGANLKTFLMSVPKSLAFTIIEDVVQSSEKAWVTKYFLQDKELKALIVSGTGG